LLVGLEVAHDHETTSGWNPQRRNSQLRSFGLSSELAPKLVDVRKAMRSSALVIVSFVDACPFLAGRRRTERDEIAHFVSVAPQRRCQDLSCSGAC
jgi:hypothetical protein